MRNVAFDQMQRSSASGSTDNEKFALSGMLVCSYALFSTGVCRIHSE